jgi:signal transduction histidine kinase
LNDIRSKFIIIISHQLRTPLTAVNWNLETLLGGKFGKFEDAQHKFLQITHDASVEITNRINNLLMAIDVEEGRVRYITEEVDLNSLCVGVVNVMMEKCELRGLSCAYTPPASGIPLIEADGEKIRTVISIMMENAINYTKEGGKINAALQLKGNVARFEVVDTGIGIPQAEQQSIFTRFFRASNSPIMQPDAFGLGLFIARNFIEQHHGNIRFESKEGVGSKFWFEIPLK